MNKQQLLDNVRIMTKNIAVLDMHKMHGFIGEKMHQLGFTKDDLDLITDMIKEEFDAEELQVMLLQEATIDYLQAVTTLLRHIKMAEGYEAMGDINKNISKEDFHLEDEVAKGESLNGKMGTENSEGESKEA